MNAVTPSTDRSLIPPDLAQVLKMSKRQFVEHGRSPDGQVIVQTGAVEVGQLTLPVEISRDVEDSLIETFVIDSSGVCEPTGDAQDLNTFWLPFVQSMAQQVNAALVAVGVLTEDPAFVTASLTPVGQVNGDAHFDDDQFIPDDGVGVVAIASSGTGPRVALDPLPVGEPQPGLSLDVGPELIDGLTSGHARHQQSSGQHIVLFPQFAQLHSGPGPAIGESKLRNLLVYRARTVPAA